MNFMELKGAHGGGINSCNHINVFILPEKVDILFNIINSIIFLISVWKITVHTISFVSTDPYPSDG